MARGQGRRVDVEHTEDTEISRAEALAQITDADNPFHLRIPIPEPRVHDRDRGIIPRSEAEELVRRRAECGALPYRLPDPEPEDPRAGRLYSRRRPAMILTPEEALLERVEMLQEGLVAVQGELAAVRERLTKLEGHTPTRSSRRRSR